MNAPRHNPALMAQVVSAPLDTIDDDEIDNAMRLAASLKRRAHDNAIRARHGLRPLTSAEIVAENKVSQARRQSRNLSARYAR